MTNRLPGAPRRGRTTERGGPARASTNRRWRSRLAGLAVIAITVVGSVSIAAPASAADYPSWDDVQAAKGNEAAKAAEVTRITDFIKTLQVELQQAQDEAKKRGEEFQAAEEAFFEADERANQIQTQADAKQTEADTATKQAGRVASQLYRSGGADLSLSLFLDEKTSGASDLLSKLGNMSKVADHSNGVYEEALAASNTAKALGEQASLARDERETLRQAAQAAMVASQAAATAAADKLKQNQDLIVTLQAQLKALQDTTSATVAQYEAGEAARKAAEAAAAAARGQAADGGQLSSQGWAVPASGNITGYFGNRDPISTGGGTSSSSHRGTDIGASCGSNIYAATGGTVTYAGWYGTYGNFILIDHGDGVSTGYAHIVNGGYEVQEGYQVSAGQVIAHVGTTGASTGCHLHFEVRINGTAIDAQPFMADRGAGLG
ncbi:MULTISPECIES: peptidoglycan DD-metalloendopeptidase family protein [unclassified Plantibacter]|uniref:peptidoglycan DD-metalloendopeptidase family protein n=1 Tax=unclassified Plantibacter TaxID=2624265 RepID=UPI003D340EFA